MRFPLQDAKTDVIHADGDGFILITGSGHKPGDKVTVKGYTFTLVHTEGFLINPGQKWEVRWFAKAGAAEVPSDEDEHKPRSAPKVRQRLRGRKHRSKFL